MKIKEAIAHWNSEAFMPKGTRTILQTAGLIAWHDDCKGAGWRPTDKGLLAGLSFTTDNSQDS